MQPEAWHGTDARKIEKGWQSFDLHTLDPPTGRRPRAGDVILIGLEGDADWLREPIDRALIFVLSTTPSVYVERLRRIAADGARSIALVFESHAKAKRFGQTGFVLPPFVDIAPFAATERRASSPPGRLRISTVGQDGRRVVASDDLSVIKAVAELGDELQLFDPGPLRYEFGTTTTVSCIARSEMSLATLLGTVDVHLHRSLPWWAEDAGESIFGPMAAGVPVLCPRDSIYAEYIDDGIDGWLYDDARSAAARLAALRNDREALTTAGRTARERALRLFDPHVLGEAYVNVVRRWREST
jgi:glycosyltransferase involved in cell wall biosynthesis